MTFGSLFAGIGGFDLGLERAGMACRWQVEIDPFCLAVLEKHWPHVRRHDDVRTFPPEPLEDWKVDLICGGFPCQDISCAGKKAGIDGERSGLWFEFARTIRDLRPRYVLVENVPALLVRGMDRVLGSLAALGYDAEWGVLSAASVGASHLRERVFIVAYPTSIGLERPQSFGEWFGFDKIFAHGSREVAYADCSGLEVRPCFGEDTRQELAAFERGCREGSGVWAVEPDVDRVAPRVPRRVDRLRSLGNAVVPQVVEFIGRKIIEREEMMAKAPKNPKSPQKPVPPAEKSMPPKKGMNTTKKGGKSC